MNATYKPNNGSIKHSRLPNSHTSILGTDPKDAVTQIFNTNIYILPVQMCSSISGLHSNLNAYENKNCSFAHNSFVETALVIQNL